MDKLRPSSKLLIIAALLQATWGIVPSASELVISQIPVELYIAIRWTISGFIFTTILLLTEGLRVVLKKSSLAVAIYGLLGYSVGSLGTLYGLKIGGVINFALVSAISPLITSVVSITVLKEKPEKKFYFALPVSIFGILLIVIGKHDLSNWTVALSSLGLIVTAYILEAIVFVFSKKLYSSHSRVAYLAIAQMSAALGAWFAQIIHFQQWHEISALTQNGWFAALFVSVVACVICYYILHWLVLYIPGHKLSLFDGIHGLSAVCFGAFFFHESLNLLMLIGGIGIFAGLLIGYWPSNDDMIVKAEEPL